MQIIILGMHRSGTSSVARLLNLMGAYLGEGDEMLPSRPDNPKGFWERRDIQVLHDETLARMECAWHDVADFSLDDAGEKVREEFDERVRSILRRLETRRPWVVKDPRLCLFFEWWRPLLESPLVVLVWRHPLQTAWSLKQRNKIPLPVGLALWEIYTLLALKACRETAVVFVSHGRLMQKPADATTDLYQQLSDQGVTGLHLPSAKEIKAFINPELFHHHQQNDEDLTGRQRQLLEVLEAGALPYPDDLLSPSGPVLETVRAYGSWVRETAFCSAQSAELEKKKLELKTLCGRLEALEAADAAHRQALVNAKRLVLEMTEEGRTAAELTGRLRSLLVEKRRALQDVKADLFRARQAADRSRRELNQARQEWVAAGEKTTAVLERFEAFQRQLIDQRDRCRAELDAVYGSRTWRWGRRLFGALPYAYRRLTGRSAGIGTSTRGRKTRGTTPSAGTEKETPTTPRPAGGRVLSAEEHVENSGDEGKEATESKSPVIRWRQWQPNDPTLEELLPLLSETPLFIECPDEVPVSLVVPVYNGFEFLGPLFESIAKNTSLPYRLIVVNDASTDERVGAWLRKQVEVNEQLELIENEKNLGFVASVNRAAKRVRGHFVILNSDVEVPPHWLERLTWPLYFLQGVASVTPFTNAGTICSFPDFPQDAPLFEGLDLQAIDGEFRRIATGRRYFTLPTGVGFCMAVHRKVWEQVGPFDEKTFGHGYGEENDWCRRASAKGFDNLLAPNLFVFHRHGGSFDPETRTAQLERNVAKVGARYPDYAEAVASYCRKDPPRGVRDLVLMLVSANRWARRVILVADHNLGGGAALYREQAHRHRENKRDAWLIFSYDAHRRDFFITYRHDGSREAVFRFATLDMLEPLFRYLSVHEIIINNLVTFPDPPAVLDFLHRLRSGRRATMRLMVHDYFMICPSCNLLDAGGRYCALEDLGRCGECLPENAQALSEYRSADISKWRAVWRRMMENCDEIRCFSDSSRQILRKAYPMISAGGITVIPHRVDDMTPLDAGGNRRPWYAIGVPGYLALHKGAGLVRDMRSLIADRRLNLRLVVIGQGDGSDGLPTGARPELTVTGSYRREDLPALVAAHGIDVMWIPSIWPETFSFTTEECIRLGLPVVVFDLGAPAERVRDYDKGVVVPRMDAEAALEAVCDYLKTTRGAVIEPASSCRNDGG